MILLPAFLSLRLAAFGQSYFEVVPSAGPRTVLAALAPYYNLNDANLKPWHLKVTYQLDDENGKPSAQGSFEYWWASPSVNHSEWRLGDATDSEWHTADGRYLFRSTGAPRSIYEHWLQTILLSPLPEAAELDPGKSIVVDHSDSSSGSHTRCFMVVPLEITEMVAKKLPFASYPEYCVNKSKPILLGYYPFGNLMVRCVNFTEMQGKSLPREIQVIDGSHEVLYAKIDSVETNSLPDAAFAPAADAIPARVDKVELSSAVATGLLMKRVAPKLPEDVKTSNGGTVVLETIVGPNGGVEDLHLISASDPALVEAAFKSVSQWEYKPYRVGGLPVPIKTTVSLDFPVKN